MQVMNSTTIRTMFVPLLCEKLFVIPHRGQVFPPRLTYSAGFVAKGAGAGEKAGC